MKNNDEGKCGLLTPLAIVGEWVMIGFTFCVCLVVTFCLWSIPAFAFVRNAWRALVFWLTVDRVCSWCKNTTHYSPFFNGHVTHGICTECLALQLRQAGLTHDEGQIRDTVKRNIHKAYHGGDQAQPGPN